MDILNFIGQIIQAIVWPITALTIVLLLREPLCRVIPLLEKLKYKDFELQFRQQLEMVKQEISLEKERGLTDTDIQTIKLAEVSPRTAIQEAWRQIETAAQKKMFELIPKEQRKKRWLKDAAHYLEFSGALIPMTAKALRDIYFLRNRAAHSPEFALTTNDALEYISVARQIQRQIEAISELPKVKLQVLTLLILEINHLIDTGRYNDISISDIYREIEKGSVLRFLKEKAGSDIIILGSLLEPDTYPNFEQYYSEQLQQLYNAYGGDERKWGVNNLGLCLLLAWTNEIIQHGSGWYPSD